MSETAYTIQQAKDARRHLDQQITRLLSEYAKEFGVEIERINLGRATLDDRTIGYYAEVEVRL
jgi:hypothetical protein